MAVKNGLMGGCGGVSDGCARGVCLEEWMVGECLQRQESVVGIWTGCAEGGTEVFCCRFAGVVVFLVKRGLL